MFNPVFQWLVSVLVGGWPLYPSGPLPTVAPPASSPPAGFTKFVTFRLIELYPDCSTDEKQQRNKLPQRQYYKVKTEQKMRAQ